MAKQTAQRTVKRVLLGHEIAYLRNRMGISQAELGKAIDKRQGQIALVELGQGTVTTEELGLLLDRLDVTAEDHRAAVFEMHRDSHKRGEWTTGFNRAYGENLRLLIDMERHADQIFWATFEIIPGLLQSPAYVRSLCDRQRLPRGLTAEDVVRAWQARQELLTKPGAPTVHVVISESGLRRKWGDSDVMRTQMAFLEEVSYHPNVLLQVLTFDASESDLRPIGHGYCLLRVPTSGLAGDLHMAYNEGVNEVYYRDDPKALDAHDGARVAMAAAALGPEDTRQFIRHISGTFR